MGHASVPEPARRYRVVVRAAVERTVHARAGGCRDAAVHWSGRDVDRLAAGRDSGRTAEWAAEPDAGHEPRQRHVNDAAAREQARVHPGARTHSIFHSPLCMHVCVSVCLYLCLYVCSLLLASLRRHPRDLTLCCARLSVCVIVCVCTRPRFAHPSDGLCDFCACLCRPREHVGFTGDVAVSACVDIM